MIKKIFSISMFLLSFSLLAQEHFPKNDGVKSKNTNYTAFTNAKIYVTPTQIIDNGTLLIKDGRVVNSGTSVKIPDNAVIVDVSGKSIYPSFIDIYSSFGVAKPKREGGFNRSPQYDASREGFYWNDHIRPEQNAVEHFKFDSKTATDLRKAGFGVVNTHLQDGIIRGTGALVALIDNISDADRIIEGRSAQYNSFSKSVKSRQSYPTSLMGSMALLRQVNHDAAWYKQGNSTSKDRALEAFNANKGLVQIFDAGSKDNVLRVDKLGDEFNTQYVIVAGGDEYERIAKIKQANAKLIVPLNFPDAYDVEDSFLTSVLDISSMREWNQKPANPKIVADNNIPFTLTMHKLKGSKDFSANLMKAIEYGLDKTKALEALTTVPASILGKSNMIGSLKNNAYANFLITSGDVFSKSTTLYENWIKGQKHVLESMNTKDIRGDYSFSAGGNTYKISITGTPNKPSAKVTSGDNELGSKLKYANDWINLSFTSNATDKQEFFRFVSKVSDNDNLSGKLVYPNGNETSVFAKKAPKETDSDSKEKSSRDDKKMKEVMPVTFPNNAYGFKSLPQQETLLFKNATVWTNEDAGIENTDVLIKDGKIAKIGANLSASGAKVIDAKGKHLTAGIVDEHSHIAAAAINEAGHNSTAEVTIEDVINADDINIYRNLAGGVTSIQILHGSANPIGGRSAIIKLKWGEDADQLIYKNTPKFIKFALGENVKQANWGDQQTIRFPQSRMGVEQLYIDYFTRARAYDKAKKSGKPYRKDIEMDILSEILNKERYISCHSYVQSEINMLMKVAEQFDFNINTFTHILEGYKVADKMKTHGVGGSTFT